MADDEKNETTEEPTPEVEAVETPVADNEAPVPGTDESVPGTDSAPEADAATPESDEQVPDADGTETAATPAAKRAKSQRHVPRIARRTRSKTTREKPATRK